MRTGRRTYVQTNMTKRIVAFRNFGNAPKNPTRRGFGAILFKSTSRRSTAGGKGSGSLPVGNFGIFRGFLLISSSQSRLHRPRNESTVIKIQDDSLAISPKLLPIKHYVIETIAWKFIYTYRERCKTGPAHNRCWKWSHFTSKHTGMRLQTIVGGL
jgi:hypothetical protein